MSARVGDQFGPYLLLSKLAQGGMGEVFLARKQAAEGFRRHVVVKRMLSHLADRADFLEMFFAEARLASRLHHPRIASVHDAGRVGDDYFLEMEFVPGVDLKAVLQRAVARGRPLPVSVVAELIAQAAEGLGYAHAATDHDGKALNLVHRDINPSNLMVSWDGELKIIDLGIAKSALAHGKTETGMLKGKFLYMSPEQSEGLALTGQSDLFALGLVLVEAVTGRHPYDRGTLARTLAAIQADPVPILLDPALQPLQSVLGRCLAKAPEDRFVDGAAMAAALREALSALPPSEGPAAVMKRLFDEERRAQIELMAIDEPERLRALHAEANPEVSVLPTLAEGQQRPEGWTDFWSDGATKAEAADEEPVAAEGPTRRRWGWWLGAAAMALLAGLFAFRGDVRPSPDAGPRPDAGPADAGRAVAPPRPDAGVKALAEAGPSPRDVEPEKRPKVRPPEPPKVLPPTLRIRGQGLDLRPFDGTKAEGGFVATAQGFQVTGTWRRGPGGRVDVGVLAEPWAIVYADDGPALGRTPPRRRVTVVAGRATRIRFRHPTLGNRSLTLSLAR